MADNSLKISYKIYLEAEDISQSRISSTASYVSNLFKNCTNSYLQTVSYTHLTLPTICSV